MEAPVGKSTSLGLKSKVFVGYTFFSAIQIDDIIEEFGEFWAGQEYEPFSHNCNFFSKYLIEHLVHQEGEFYFPRYVNRFSKLSSLLRIWFNPLQTLLGDVVKAPEGSDSEESEEESDEPE